MKFSLTKRRKWLLATGAALLLTATPSFALFGIGDIVFDPTSYASLVSQATTALNQLRTIQNNVMHFNAKQQWQAVRNILENYDVASLFGETNGIKISLNSNSPSFSVTGWKNATLSMNSNTTDYLRALDPNSSMRGHLAMIEVSDAISPQCLTAVGQYHANRDQNSSAVSSLSSWQLDTGDDSNSEVQQLNLLNAAAAQQMAEAQAQGTLQSCLASQMTVANMQQRNAAVQDINTAAFVQQQRSTNNAKAASEGSPWPTTTSPNPIPLPAYGSGVHEGESKHGDHCSNGAGTSRNKFRGGLALPVHEQLDESDDCQRRGAHAVRID